MCTRLTVYLTVCLTVCLTVYLTARLTARRLSPHVSLLIGRGAGWQGGSTEWPSVQKGVNVRLVQVPSLIYTVRDCMLYSSLDRICWLCAESYNSA